MQYLVMIYAKILPASDTRGTRVKAIMWDGSDSVTLPWDHEFSGTINAANACDAVAAKRAERLGKRYEFVGVGETPNGNGYAFAYRVKTNEEI